MTKMMETRGANVLIVDEAHSLDSVMSDFISIKITEFLIKKLKFSNETQLIKELKSINNISEYVEYLRNLQGEIITTINDVEKLMGRQKRTVKSIKRENSVNKVIGGKNSDVKLMQVITDLLQYFK